MIDNAANDRSLANTIADDDRAEVSFSFDGREVSVSLYETPDLTEEEALQIVEMYAEELSEHVSGMLSVMQTIDHFSHINIKTSLVLNLSYFIVISTHNIQLHII
jgi:hypothetical protein